MKKKILVIDDEKSLREFLNIFLKRHGFVVTLADDVPTAILELKKEHFDLVLTDLKLPSGTGLDILSYIKEHEEITAQVVLMTAFATTKNAVKAMQLGAYDYLIKPFQNDELLVIFERALERQQLKEENTSLRNSLSARVAHQRLIGVSHVMKDIFQMVKKVAKGRTNILITGKSGTGKEMIARSIHEHGPRVDKEFIAINCGAIPENLIESELFGHKKGSFTGADADKKGLFEQAGEGTLFLDEIGELPLLMQVRLLRVLQERYVRPLGSSKQVEVKCRIVAATNRILEEEVKKGRFREDLFFRLNVIQIELPSLKERHEDIPLLTSAFLAKFSEQQGVEINQVSDAAMQRLLTYSWPGNIRELENVIERAVTFAESSCIEVSDLTKPLQNLHINEISNSILTPKSEHISEVMILNNLGDDTFILESFLEQIESQHMSEALKQSKGRKGKAADLLGISFRRFRYRMNKLGLLSQHFDQETKD